MGLISTFNITKGISLRFILSFQMAGSSPIGLSPSATDRVVFSGGQQWSECPVIIYGNNDGATGTISRRPRSVYTSIYG